MKRILVTGGDGLLGNKLVESVANKQATVRVMSRKPEQKDVGSHLEWAQADVTTGEGVAEALQHVDTVINCMSSPLSNTYETDIVGTRNFLAQAKKSGVQCLTHISIIGIDRIVFPYYQYKLGAELVVAESGIPYMIARIGQFHGFVDYLLSPLKEVEANEVAIPTNVKFQPISPKDVAGHLAPYIIDATYQGRLPDFGGPEILCLQELAAAWLKVQGMNRMIKPATETENDLPLLSYFGDGFLNGYNTNPDNRVGEIYWQDYLRQTYGERSK